MIHCGPDLDLSPFCSPLVPTNDGLPQYTPDGVQACSRGLSAATPTVRGLIFTDPVWVAARRDLAPFQGAFVCFQLSGGVAALNHRLIA